MIRTPRRSWLPAWLRRTPTAPARRPRRLGCERLEDRVNPVDPVVSQLDLGGLRFVASDNFARASDGDYTTEKGTVGIGYTPAGSESFVPLIQYNLDNPQAQFILYSVTNPNQFSFDLGTVELLPGGTPGVPIPVYKPGNQATMFDIPTLLGKSGAGAPGLSLDPDHALPIEVAGIKVTPTLLLLNNPNDGDTSDAQAKAQGTVTFEDVPLLSGLGLEADVDKTNYLISDSTGINLTGAVISKTWTFDGVTVAGEIDVGYDRPTATFTIGGGVNVTNTAQPNGKAFLQNVDADILFSIKDGVLTAFQFQVAGSFTLFETLTVSTQTNEPLVFKYQLPTDTDPNKYFEVGGSLLFQFNGQTIEAELVDSDGNPGVVLTNGHLTSFTGTFDVDLHLFGATLSTAPTGGLTVVYQAAVPPSGTDPGHADRFVIYGGLTFGFAGQTVEASLGDADAPGFTIVDGSLTELNLGLAAGINAFGLKLNIGTVGDPAMVRWVKADNSFNISGTFTADFQVFQTRLVLGGTETPGSGKDNAKGLSIVNGHLSVPEGGKIVFDLQDAVLGPVDLKDLELTYTSLAMGGIDVDVKAAVGLPGGWSAAGEFDLKKDANQSVKLETISIELSPAPGALPIGDTGLSVTDIAVKVTNIDTPSQIVVTGDVAVVWGEQISLLGQDVFLFRAQGNVLASAEEFVLDCQALFGAYSADGGNTWQGVLGQGDAKLTLDWADNYYALHAEVDGLAGIFNVKGDFVFESGREIAILAEAEVVIPQEVPFIGGDTLGGVGFFFQHVFAHDTTSASTTFAAWITVDIFTTFTVGFEVVADANGLQPPQIIGASQVAQFEQDVAPPVNQNFTFTSTFTRGTDAGQIAPGTTSLVLGVDWSEPAVGVGLNGAPTFQVVPIVNGTEGTPIAEKDFAANGISFITDSRFNTPTSKAIQLVGSATDGYAPLTADYKLLVTFSTVGGNPFPSYPSLTAADVLKVEATAHVPVPTFGPRGATSPVGPAVPAGRPTAAFPVTVSGNIDEAFFEQAQVTLYRIRQNDPFQRGVKVGTVAVTPANATLLAVDAGGSGGGEFVVDGYVTGGGEYQSPAAVDTSKVVNPAPAAVYQNVRTSAGGEFTYTLPGLVTGRAYTVRLHFAEVGGVGPGGRKFHVDINGTRVLTDFDIAAAAGGLNTAYAASFPAAADANGQITVAFKNGSLNTAIVSGIEVLPANPAVLAVNAGGDGDGIYTFDQYAMGGGIVGAGSTVDTSRVVNPAPQSVYQTARSTQDFYSEFTYALPGLSPGSWHAVRLHFAGISVFDGRFHVEINGTRVLTDFDPVAAAGGSYIAIVRTFDAVADANGQIAVRFLNGSTGSAFVNGIEVLSQSSGENWTATVTAPIQGLYAEGYTYYAVIDDGFNPPVQSVVSAPVTPAFAVQGTVANQAGDPEGGWSVYLDYNGNGQLDPNEPSTVTNAGGFYSFSPTFPNSPGVDPVPVNAPAVVRLGVQGPEKYAPVTMPSVTYSGSAAAVANFPLQEFSAIKGTVFVDRNNDGVNDGDAGAARAVVYLDQNGNAQRDPGEPTATTDTHGHYGFGGVAAGPYTVALDLSPLTPSAAAYAVPAGTVGLQSGYTYGMTFTVDKPVVVSSLGVFDSGGDGFSGPLTATLYDTRTRTALATLTFTPAAPGTLTGGTRFLPLATPITLPAGFQGMIVAGGFTPQDPGGNANQPTFGATPAWTTNNGVGRLTFGRSLYASGAGYPTNPDASTFPNVYAAGSFLFAAPAWEQTSPNPLVRSVTVGGGGFSLQEGNDFGVLPPAFVTGTVTGHGYVNGRLAPDPTPQAGVTVNLLADQLTFAVNVGGGAVGLFDPDLAPGGTTTGAAIDTSRVIRPAPQAVYQSARVWSGGTQNTFTFSHDPGRYTVRLHFAELTAGAPGERRFNVAINGVRVLTDYDIVASAGGPNTAVVEEFTVDTTSTGRIDVTFSAGSAGDPTVNGIELLQPGAVVATTTTDGNGTYSLTTYVPGRYVAQVVPPAGWRQVAPYVSDFQTAAGTLLPAAAGGLHSATADFDGDGFLDLATTRAGGDGGVGAVWVGYNQHDGTFGRADEVSLLLPTRVLQFGAADLNGDGRPDLVVLNRFQDNGLTGLDAYLNTGSAAPGQRFQFVPNYWVLPAAVQSRTIYDLTSADLNGDGLPDLLVSVGDSSLVGTNPAAVAVLLNAVQPGDRTAAAYPLPATGYQYERYTPGRLAVADLNADGHPDLVTSGGTLSTSYVTFFTALGDGTGGLGGWTSYADLLGAYGGSVAAADLGHDGAADAAVYKYFFNPSGQVKGGLIYLGVNRGNGVLDVPELSTLPAAGTAPPPAREVALRDVDGDLRPDLVVLLSSDQAVPGSDRVLVYLNTGTAPYVDPSDPITVSIPGGGATFQATDLLVADFTNDGLADFLVLSDDGGYLIVNTSPPGQPGVAFGLTPAGTAAGNDLVLAQDAPPAVGAVQGEVFEDAGRNGRREAGETGRAGAFVFADLNRNGRHDAGEPSTATIARGLYALPGLAPGSYSVGVIPEDGWHPTEFAEVAVGGSGPARADFARVRRLLGEVGPQAVRAGDHLAVTVPLTAAAGGLVYSLEGDVPAGLTIHPTAGRLEWSPRAEHVGTHAVTVRVRDPLSPTFTETRTVSVEVAAPVVPPAAPSTPLIAVGGLGGVRVYSAEGAPRLTLSPFGDGFGGEVRVATGDVNGDGVDDIVTAAGPGGGPHVKVFDGATGAERFSFFAFEPAFAGGVWVAAGDVTGDGVADVVVGAGADGGPRVRVFDGRDLALVRDFFAYDPSFTGGVHVAAGDVDGDGRAEVIVGAGAGGGPHVQVFDGRTGGLMTSFFAFDAAFRGGVLVAAGDLDGDGHAEVATSPGAGGGARVQAFDGAALAAAAPAGPMADFLAGPADDRGGVRVAVKPAHADRPAAVVVGSGDRGEVRAYHLTTPGEPPAELFDLDVFAGDLSGVLVG